MKQISIIYIFLILCFSTNAEFTFQQISPDGGLVQESINDIVQDNNGAIWIATKDGLIKYTTGGYMTYHHSPTDSLSLCNNVVNSLFIDKDENLWVSTGRGVCIYNPEENNFIPFRYDPKYPTIVPNNVLQLHIDNKSNVWLLHGQGLGILNRANKQLFPIDIPDRQYPSVIYEDNNNVLWIGTTKGYLYQIDKETLQFTEVSRDFGSRIRSVCSDHQSLWVSTMSNGLKNISFDGELIDHPQLTKAIAANEDVRSVLLVNNKDLWIGTYNGLYIYTNEDSVIYYNARIRNLPHSSVYKIYEDRKHGVWVGTWSGGVSYYNEFNNSFKNFRYNGSTSSLSNNIVSSFAEDQSHEIYVSTEAGGINHFDPQTEMFKTLQLDAKNTMANMKCQTFDKNGGHWIGTNKNGLWYKAKGERFYHHFSFGDEDGEHTSYNEIYSLQADDKGVWIGTHGGGVNFYDFKKKEIEYVNIIFEKGISTNSKFIRTLHKDKDNVLFLGTLMGVFMVDLNTSDKKARAITSDYVYHICSIGEDEIWIGTKFNGIQIYNKKEKTLIYFDANGLINSKSIYGILEDNNKNIWITSENGLIFYEVSTQKIRRFTVEDGIQGAWFIAQAVFKSSSNELYFGGTNGFTMVNPKFFKKNEKIPEVFVSRVSINNTRDIYKGLANRNILKLKPSENTLRIYFHSDNYLSSSKNQYKYRVINYIDEWESVTNQTNVLFTNLNSGKYTFEVKTANNDGIWSDESVSFDFIIRQPYYRSIVAIVIYILMVVMAVYISLRTAKRRLSLRVEIDKERMRHQQEEQVQELKLKLFTNISHEFRTPLTLIAGPLKKLIADQSLSEPQRRTADIIHRNTQRMLNLINQLIDLRKIDKGVEELEISSLDIVNFIKESSKNFAFKAEEKHISFDVNSETPNVTIDFDSIKIDYIMTNLLSNAFNYTPAKGSISIDISLNSQINNNFSNQLVFGTKPVGDVVSISVTDSGAGIEGNEISLIFNRFKQGKEHKEGSGIGLYLCKQYVLLHHGCLVVQSTSGKGSSFTFLLPARQSGSRLLQGNTNLFEDYVEAPEIQQVIEPDKEEDSGEKETILIVEDNQDLSNYISNLLQDHHYNTLTVGNGVEAIERMMFSNIDLIISDVMMPEMDGFELCTKLKSDLSSCHTPIILLTALNTTQNQILGLNKGANAYISKPFEEDFLISQVKNLMFQRKQLHDYFASKQYLGPNKQLEGLDNYFLSKLNAIIVENLANEELDVDLIVGSIGLSRSQLHRKLKQLTNFSITEYVRKYRLEKAIELMKSKEFNIDEIAFRVGFNTHSYFTRCFKKQYGVSPKEYMNTKL